MIDFLIVLPILGLAAARLTLLLVADDIFEPLRHRLFMLSPPMNNEVLGWNYQNWEYTKNVVGSATPIRKVFNRRYKLSSVPVRSPGFFGRLFSCVDCLGVWMGGAVAGTWYLAGDSIYVFTIFAVSMIVSLIGRKYL